MPVTPKELRLVVETHLSPDLYDQLEAKRKDSDRSMAAELRQAIRAWVEPDSEHDLEKVAA